MTGPDLRRRRQAAGLSLDDLARASGLTVGAIYKIESGRTRKPGARTLRDMDAALVAAEKKRKRSYPKKNH